MKSNIYKDITKQDMTGHFIVFLWHFYARPT